MPCRLTRVTIVILMLFTTPVMAQVKKMRDALPPPTGKWPVGRSTFYWKAGAQGATSEKTRDARELRVDVWYPAALDGGGVKAAYCPDLPTIKSRLGFESAAQANIETHTYLDPAMAEVEPKFPIVLFSPGFSTNANQYTALAEELVSHRYVVATVDHPYQSQAIAYPDGRVIAVKDEAREIRGDPEKSFQNYRDRVTSRVDDLQFVLNQLTRMHEGEIDARFAGRLDLERVGVAGHSLGGVAAPSACMRDPRFKAAANMDGHARSLPMLVDENGAGPQQPFLELTDSNTPPRPSDAQLEQWKITREESDRNADVQKKRYEALMATISGGSFRVTVPGATHQSFSDSVLWVANNPKPHFRRTQIVRDYTRAFFDKFLRGDGDTLFDSAQGPYEEVTVERFRLAPQSPPSP
jgi:alpha-beta hydrolase superfamily lysophospholipase